MNTSTASSLETTESASTHPSSISELGDASNLNVQRRRLLQVGLSAVATIPLVAQAQTGAATPPSTSAVASEETVTFERRGNVALIGINRPAAQNRIDPATFAALGRAYYQYEQDPTLRAAVLFGHGDNFSMGLDAQAFGPSIASGKFTLDVPGTINPMGTSKAWLTKPLIVVVQGNAWFVGHELCLAADIRIAASNAKFSQGEVNYALFPGGGGTIRFVQEAGWGQAMRYILTGEVWDAAEAKRLGLFQEVATTPEAAMKLALDMASKIAAEAPLAIKAALASAHAAASSADQQQAYAALLPQFGALMRTQDFQERMHSIGEKRAPVYQGK